MDEGEAPISPQRTEKTSPTHHETRVASTTSSPIATAGQGVAALLSCEPTIVKNQQHRSRHTSKGFGEAVFASEAMDLLAEADDLLARHKNFMSNMSTPFRATALSPSVPAASFQPSSPIAFTAITHFDLRQGPSLLCVVPRLEDPRVAPATREAIRSMLPFKSLPEKGIAATQLLGATDSGEDRLIFMIYGAEILFGASHFIRLEDPSSKRGFSQAAVVVLARVPFFGVLLQRLHAFSTEVLHRSDCAEQLALFHSSLTNMGFLELGHSLLYLDLPVADLLVQFGGHVLSLLRLILLEGRILVTSSSALKASTAAVTLASLLPGCLALGFGHDAAAFVARAYRWQKHGLPLRCFSRTVRLEPLVVMANAASLLTCRGFVAGTTNKQIESMPQSNLDCLLDLDTGKILTGRSVKAQAAFTPGVEDKSFAQRMAKAAKDHQIAEQAGGGVEGANWQGSPAWVGDQFQLFFEELTIRAAVAVLRDEELTCEDETKSVASGTQNGANIPPMFGGGSRRNSHNSSRRGSSLENGAPGGQGGNTSRRTSTGDDNSGVGGLFAGFGIAAAWAGEQAKSRLSDAASKLMSGTSGRPTLGSMLDEYGKAWAEEWVKTKNFQRWTTEHKLPREDLMARIHASQGAGSGKVGPPQHGVHTYTYPNGDFYNGSFRNGRRHGQGLLVEFASGTTYEGSHQNDLRHGKGVLTSGARDYCYDGDWVRGVRSGQGQCAYKGKETYSGGWLDNQYHGEGTHCSANGDVYVGEFRHGVREGVGRLSTGLHVTNPSENGANVVITEPLTSAVGTDFVYVGEFVRSLRDGLGQCTYRSGALYSGQWKAGEWSGEGSLTLPGGASHSGMWSCGVPNGPGTYTTGDGEIREGVWRDGEPVTGVEWRIRYRTGDEYMGTCNPGSFTEAGTSIPNGSGTFKYSNGDVYTGNFVDGLRSGHGVCVFANGERFEGEWSKDQISLLGKGRLTLSDGTSHEYT